MCLSVCLSVCLFVRLSVCLSVCLPVCVLRMCNIRVFYVFADCDSWTRPISTNRGSMEAHEYGLTRRTCFIARRVEVVAVAGLLWISWCGLDAAGLFRVFQVFTFSNSCTTAGCERPRAVSVDSMKGLRQPANLPTENSSPPIPTKCTIYYAPT